MLAERTDWFLPSASVGRTQQRGETRAAIWQACREFGRNSIFNMRRRQATSNLQLESAAFCKNRNSKGVGRRRSPNRRRFVCDAGHWHFLSYRLERGYPAGPSLLTAPLETRRVFAPFIEQFPFYSRMTPSYSRHGRRRRCPSVRPSVHPFGALKERAPHYAG